MMHTTRIRGRRNWLAGFSFALVWRCSDVTATERKIMHVSAWTAADLIGEVLNTANIPSSELQTLKDLYTSTDGDNWLWTTPYNDANGYPWNFSANADPCTDLWQGITCSILAQQYHISTLTLVDKRMDGTLPDSLSQLAQLSELVLQDRFISGTIPYSIGDLSLLTVLHITTSILHGPIPNTLGQLSHLDSLIISYSLLSGTIPYSLSQLGNLTYMQFKNNALTGSIPDVFNDMPYLLDIVLSDNHLNGTIPSLVNSSAQRLQSYLLYSNAFTGTLPIELTDLRGLHYIDFHNNHLSGPIPEQYGNLNPELITLDINENALTGTIPASLGNLHSLQNFEVSFNQFHGTLPDTLCACTALHFIDVGANALTGAIPPCLGHLAALEYLYLTINSFTGGIPDTFGGLSSILYLDMAINRLTGTIPVQLGQLATLQQLVLSQNYLHGRIPTSFAELGSLQVLALHYNDLSGTLTGVFDPTVQTALTTIQMNNNPFTGTLPPELFQLPYLTSIALVANCLTGTLPAETLCQHNRLENLMLDGLSSSSRCRQKLLPGLFTSYTITKQVGGTIPPCIFALPNLSSLHLSGNGFTGSLPESLILGPHLLNLTLSHNTLTGSIPAVIQERKWDSLDLSYNRLSGTLSDGFASVLPNRTVNQAPQSSTVNNGFSALFTDPEPSVALENNRLSGKIPGVLHSFSSLSMLGSNLFSCKVDNSDLPTQDSSADTYECGSNAFDVNYYVWLGLLVPAVGTVVYLWWTEHAVLLQTLKPDTIGAFGHRLQALHDVSRGCTVYILVVLLPLYCSLGSAYHTYMHLYAWRISSAFLSGVVPCALMFVFLAGLLCVILALFRRGLTGESPNAVTQAQDVWVHRPQLNTIAIYTIFTAVNVVVVLGVNIAYVYIAIYESSGLETFAQVVLSIFKVVWNTVVAPRFLKRLARYWTDKTDYSYIEEEFALLQLSLALFNNIGIPFLVVACISPSCFYNDFVDAPEVRSYFRYTTCVVVNDNTGECTLSVPASGSVYYNPPFTYSYQCSSSLITYYAPAYVNTCIINTFVAPIWQWALQALLHRAKSDTWLHREIGEWVPPLLKPCPADRTPEQVAKLHILHGDTEIIALITNVALLVTFGAVFPPLAAALAVTVLASVYFIRFKVLRYLALAHEAHHEPFAERVRKECEEVSVVPLLANTMWMLVTLAALFYTLFLFDTLGDAVGAQGAYWVLIVMPLLPLCMYGALRLWSAPSNNVNASSAAARTGDPEIGNSDTDLHKDTTTEATGRPVSRRQMELSALPPPGTRSSITTMATTEREQINALWLPPQSETM